MPSHVPKYGNLFEFGEDEILRNRVKTYPKVEFFIYTGSVFYNNSSQNFENSHTPQGHINLYDLNVYRNLHETETDSQLIYPFITKGGSFTSFKTVSAESYGDFSLGDTISMTYPLTSSISINRYTATKTDAKLNVLYALKNTLNHYVRDSQHYAYSSSYGEKETQPLNIISIPSIFYGSSINKGSVKLKYYVSGTLVAEAADTKRNGELLQTSGNISSHIGNQIGVVLYNEGFILLTSSYALDAHQEIYQPLNDDGSLPSANNSSWYYFATIDSSTTAASSSFKIEFEGVNYIDTITMFAHAKEGQLNFSNNPTFLRINSNKDLTNAITGSNSYIEDPANNLEIKNIVSSSHAAHSASFEPVTYISKVGIYDKNKNLIAVAGLANPVKKTTDNSYTFKLKLDI